MKSNQFRAGLFDERIFLRPGLCVQGSLKTEPMGVDFNGLRLGMQDNFNAIVAMLKECASEGGIVMVDYQVEELEQELIDLRDRLATLMCIYTDESNNIADQADLLTLDLIEE